MSITKLQDIASAVEKALAGGYPLTIEGDDFGTAVVRGDELREVWDEFDMGNWWSIKKVHDNLTPAQIAALDGDGGEFAATVERAGIATFTDADGREAGVEIYAWWSTEDPGKLVLQIDTTFESDETEFEIRLNDATILRRERKSDGEDEW